MSDQATLETQIQVYENRVFEAHKACFLATVDQGSSEANQNQTVGLEALWDASLQ